MEAKDIALVQESWQKVVPIADQAAAIFYRRLFALDPSIEPLFSGDLENQGRKLTQMIGTVVVNLGRLGTIVPTVEDLGRRHVRYGVEPRHYRTVGEALLWTLEQGLGEAFTADTRKAWTEAYTILSEVMQSAAARSEPGPVVSSV
ncbi:MAG: hemin receptor [Gammaproteobacteria bacterium]|nr:hemin receptor [Gammaproteobacteria bacterium]